LAVSNEIKRLKAAPGDLPFFGPRVRIPQASPSRPANAERSAAADAQASPTFPFYHDFRFSGRKCRGAAESAQPQGLPGRARYRRKGGRIAELAPNGSERVRRLAADFRHRPGG